MLQVEYMISEAMNTENLCLMYEGWMAWVWTCGRVSWLPSTPCPAVCVRAVRPARSRRSDTADTAGSDTVRRADRPDNTRSRLWETSLYHLLRLFYFLFSLCLPVAVTDVALTSHTWQHYSYGVVLLDTDITVLTSRTLGPTKTHTYITIIYQVICREYLNLIMLLLFCKS